MTADAKTFLRGDCPAYVCTKPLGTDLQLSPSAPGTLICNTVCQFIVSNCRCAYMSEYEYFCGVGLAEKGGRRLKVALSNVLQLVI